MRTRAFQKYLNNLTSDVNKFKTLIDENSDVLEHIEARYRNLRNDLRAWDSIFVDLIDFNGGSLYEFRHLADEVGFAADLLESISRKEDAEEEREKGGSDTAANSRESSGDDGFSEDELNLINERLNHLQDGLVRAIEANSSLSEQRIKALKAVVVEGVQELKSDARKMSRKDWKLMLIPLIMSFLLQLHLSAESRNMVLYDLEVLTMICYRVDVPPDAIPPPPNVLGE